MKILILNHNYERFGTYWRCYFLGKNLAKNGHKVTMLCASGKNIDLLVRRIKESDNFTIYTLPRVRYHTYMSGQLILRLPFYLFFTIFTKYDLLYAFTVAQPQIGIPAMIAKVFLRKKRVFVDWDDLWGGGFANSHMSIINKGLTWSEAYFPKFADAVTHVSQKIHDRAIQVGIPESKLRYLPNGANHREIKVYDKISSRLKVGLNINENIILSMGNTYTYSLDILLKTFMGVLKRLPDSRLVFIGNTKIPKDKEPFYRNIINNITFAGYVKQPELSYYLASADVLALPMDNDPIEQARFPIRLGDYLSAGRPIVSNAVGEVKHYLEKYNAGLTSKPRDVKGYSDNIIRVLKDDKLAKRISKNARNLAEGELDWQRISQKLLHVYKSVMLKQLDL